LVGVTNGDGERFGRKSGTRKERNKERNERSRQTKARERLIDHILCKRRLDYGFLLVT